MCVVAGLLWIADPFAAALLIPALHLWLWALDRDLPLPAIARLAMIIVGLLPTAGLVVFYAHLLGFGPAPLAWEAVLLLSGHATSWVEAIEWSIALGCLVSATIVVLVRARRSEPVETPVSVRGPVGYAGPGSLGGTKSALRR
jgi:enoyl-CoA hydratase/carnithine racemase